MRASRVTRSSRSRACSATIASCVGSKRYPSRCTETGRSARPVGLTHENSAPRISRIPGGSAAAASPQPPVVSWSVIASTSTPARWAAATSSAGESVPSEAVEWVCRSISGGDTTGDYVLRPPLSAPPARPRQQAGGARLALLAEHQLGQGLVDLLRARHEVDPVERLDLARRLDDQRAVAEEAAADAALE